MTREVIALGILAGFTVAACDALLGGASVEVGLFWLASGAFLAAFFQHD